MSIELQSPAADLHLQEEKSDERLKNIEQEKEKLNGEGGLDLYSEEGLM
jgi:hypothetical protein